jgi:Holliday junction resolvasome RuvABC DNA-binding subunit
MILDLKEKVQKLTSRISVPPKTPLPPHEFFEDIVSALVNLGYKKHQAESAVETVFQEKPGIQLEEALKESLRILSKS